MSYNVLATSHWKADIFLGPYVHHCSAVQGHEKVDLFGGPQVHLQMSFCGKLRTKCTGVLFCPLGSLAVH